MTFYPDAEMKKPKEGLKFYYTKPYLLVARDGTSKVTSITVQYLPDLEHPVYAKAAPGYGSSNLTLAFSNGVITNFGQQVDTKVPETISSLGSLIPGYGTAVKALTDASVERRKADVEQQASDLPKDAQALKTIADGLRDVAASGSFATVDVVAMRAIADELYVPPSGANPATGIAARMEAPGAPATIDKLKADLKVDVDKLKALKAPDQMGGKAQTDWGKLAKLVAAAEDVLSDLSPAAEKPATPPVLTLYEIVMKDGATTLKEVPLPPSLDR